MKDFVSLFNAFMETKRSSWFLLSVLLIGCVTFLISGNAGLFERMVKDDQDRQERYSDKHADAVDDLREAYVLINDQVRTIAKYWQIIQDFNGEVINVPYPLWTKSLDSKIWYINHAYEDLILAHVDCPRDSLLGTRGEKCFSQKRLTEYVDNDEKLLESPDDIIIEVAYVLDRPGIVFKWMIYEGRQPWLMGMWIPLSDIWDKIDVEGSLRK